MIRAACVREPGVVEIIERPSAILGENEVRLRIEAVGVCGSDVALLAGKHPYAVYPVTPGHELAGRVTEVAAGVDVHVGDLVTVFPLLTCGKCWACRAGEPNHCAEVRVLGVHLDGGMTDEIVLPASLVRPVPGDVSAERAALIEPTAVAVHTCHRAGLARGQTLAIIGTGVIGLLALQVARAWGAGAILAVDRVPRRLNLAAELGATAVVDNRTQDVIEASARLAGRLRRGSGLVGSRAHWDASLFPGGGRSSRWRCPRDDEHRLRTVYRKELTCGPRGSMLPISTMPSRSWRRDAAVESLITQRFRLEEAGGAGAPGRHRRKRSRSW
jgi:threonine dehydrogenase-like Zn-dependent dehydrogenase